MRAIDLYAGVGGWALGLKMAGLDIAHSYEWWRPAIETHEKNIRSIVHECDIRALSLADLPKSVDVVVGSPPCTQFSFSNRGGQGDIKDGLIDVEKFLEVVAYLKPRFWAMENVPRVKQILDAHLKPRGRLRRFADLGITSMILDMSEFGVPQKRRRCVAGNFDFQLLLSYRKRCSARTLGAVLQALTKKDIVDPIYGIAMDRSALSEQEPETPLNDEEERMNRESKMFHPVYNNMAFPDPEALPVRTITATCTRVSRESVVIRAPEKPGTLRRLTIRERACLQGFPISYQFFGTTYAQKLKLIGNAIPPLMTFYIAQAIQGVSAEALVVPHKAIKKFRPALAISKRTVPDDEGRTYPATRTFRAAIPNLRFKSGVRFELSNAFGQSNTVNWRMRFYFGNSQDIRECNLNAELLNKAQRVLFNLTSWQQIAGSLSKLSKVVARFDRDELQEVWSRRANGTAPYVLVDAAGAVAGDLIPKIGTLNRELVELFVLNSLGLNIDAGGEKAKTPTGPSRKVRRFAVEIAAGFLVGATVNQALAQAPLVLAKRDKERAVA